MKRYLTLVCCVGMLLLLGTAQAWSVFVGPLRAGYGFSAFEMQLIFSTSVLVFCTMIIAGGRLHDRLGPRPLAAASAVLIGLAWGIAWAFGSHYFFLWLAIGVLANAGCAAGYVCPIATAIKWFPRHGGLISGLTAAGFGVGPVLLSWIAESLMHGGWSPMNVFGLVAVCYSPLILLTGMMLFTPAGSLGHAEAAAFDRRTLLRDRRFWTLFVGMFTGTLPFLIVMGNAKPLAVDFGVGALAATAMSALAVGNACGRIFWGLVIDRVGPRRAMLAAQMVVMAALIVLIALGSQTAGAFFVGVFAVGFCYGSNFAIYPATVTRLYGAHVLGSVYPFIMAAQGISSFGPTVNGLLKDATGSNYPGLIFALAIAAAGSVTCIVLSTSISEKRINAVALEEVRVREE